MATTLTKLYTNSPLNQEELIALLKSRGLNIADESKAVSFLEDVTYFRLAAYLRPMEQDKLTHTYKPNASIEKAIELYSFDNELRRLLFGIIQTIEISLRSRMIKHFSLESDAFWFFDESKCTDKHKYVENISTIEREIIHTKEDFIKEHGIKYGENGFPPAWKTLELVSFGCLTKLFFNYSNTKVKKRVSRSYQVPQHEILESWMKAISILRNHCAHHARIWNRIFPHTPTVPGRLKGKWLKYTGNVNPYRLYAILCCMIYWLNAIKPDNTVVQQFKDLLAKFPNVDTAAMGLPANWLDEPLWQA